MATASNATTSAGEAAGNNVPQWKRDLIQRRRQQSKVLASGGSGNSNNGSGGNGIANANAVSSSGFFSRGPACGAIVPTGASVAVAGTDVGPAVACNMRLEADFSSFCSDSEDVTNGTSSSKSSTLDMERKLEERGDGPETDVDPASVECEERVDCERSRSRTKRELPSEKFNVKTGSSARTRMRNRIDDNKDDEDNGGNDVASEESDSSEELQYGPGIVNKLKSKYLNLALKEMNKSRVSVQRFRRAASLEDLLDCDDEPGEKNRRKYTKRTTGNAIGSGGSTVVAKTDRYRNTSRGNESMKRARSVETLLRYNGSVDETTGRPISGVGSRRDSVVNDHIVLIDRTAVKIESRLGESDRPKPVNKPKRIKPLLAETERPPPDLVKTTMRIFEGSARKLKPKGEVAAKVATFKTINDTFKAQAQKKLIPKPPIQPKPFVNGNSSGPIRSGSVGSVSPKKIVLPQKPTAELIEIREGQREYHIDGVITDPIAQSVSSVVSKFRQIEKSHCSPSPSPEPSFKLRFSPAPSPEPLTQQPCKSRSSSLEISIKSPPVTPVLSPRISSPRLQSPSSPIKDALGQTSPRVRSPTSPIKDAVKLNANSPIRKLPPSPSRTEILGQQQTCTSETGKLIPSAVRPQTEPIANIPDADVTEQQRSPERLKSGFTEREFNSASNEDEELVEETDAPRTISKAALENIARTGVTMQFSFSDKPISDKSYLPGFKQNGRIECREKIEEKECMDEPESDDRIETESLSLPPELPRGKSFLSGDSASESDVVTVIGNDRESVCRLQERLEPDAFEEKIEKDRAKEETTSNKCAKTNEKSNVKPIGAICSLGLIKSSTTSSYSQGNESKTIRCQKTESPPQKQIGIIRPLVSIKTQHAQQNLSNRELEKNLINRVKSIEQPTKVVVSLKSAEEIQPAKKSSSAGAGLWDTKPWNQQNNTMVFNFSNRKDVPDYIENDGLIVKKKREKPKVGDGGIIVLDATLDASTTDDAEWELAGGPPSPCDVSFFNDNVLINGRSNLSRTPRNHKHRIQFDDTATRTFEYPSEASMLEGESCTDGETSASGEQSPPISNKTSSTGGCSAAMPTLLGGGSGGGLANYTPSKVDLTSEGFELGVTRAVSSNLSPTSTSTSTSTSISTSSLSPSPSPSPTATSQTTENEPTEIDYLKPAQDAAAWGSETTGDLLY